MNTAASESATERVVVLMTPTQKEEARRRANSAHLSLGDFIRRQTFDEPDGFEQTLAELALQIEESTTRATEALDSALASLAAAHESQNERKMLAIASAKAEFAGIDPEAFADLVASAGQKSKSP